MRHRALAAAVIGMGLAGLASAAPAMAAETVYGLTASNKLVTFASDKPGLTSTPLAVTGLQAGEDIVGVDFRPATNQLYAVGSTSRLYVVDTVTGAATQVGAVFATPLSGTTFGVDFNPNADRLRIVSDTEQNLSVNPNNGAVTAQAALNPGTPNVEGAAYTNNFPGAPSTQLFDVDTGDDSLKLQDPPGTGTLTTVGTTLFAGQSPTVDLNAGGDLDIVSRPSDNDRALALLNTTINTVPATTRARLYTINLTTGTAALIGNLPAAGPDIVEEIAVAPAIATFVGLTNASPQGLVTFRADRPGVTSTPVPISGLQSGERLAGLDTRPATGELYGVGDSNRVYTLDPVSGVATQVGSGTFTPVLSGASFGVDFNPVPDRLRIVSDADFNGRFTPTAPITNGGLTPAGDTALSYAPADANVGQNPNVTGAAYTNSFNGAAATTLFDIDSTLNILATQSPPNDGLLNTVGSLTVDPTDVNGYEIVPRFNHGYAAFQITGDTASKLYAVNAQGNAAGAAILVGSIGLPNTLLTGLTQLNTDRIAFSVADVRVAEDGTSAKVTVLRSSTGGDVPAATVAYTTANGSATAGQDYTTTAGTLSFGPGDTAKTITVPITDNAANEPDETFTIALSAPTGGAALGQPSTTTVTVDDDDAAAVTPPPPPPPPPPPAAAKPKALTLSATPTRDRTKPYKFRATGRLKLPNTLPSAACAGGKVTITLKRGTKLVSRRTVGLDADCEYSKSFTYKVSGKLRKARTLRFTARFLGNAALLAINAKSKKVKAG